MEPNPDTTPQTEPEPQWLQELGSVARDYLAQPVTVELPRWVWGNVCVSMDAARRAQDAPQWMHDAAAAIEIALDRA